MRHTLSVRKKIKNVTKKGGGLLKSIGKKIKYTQLRKEKGYIGKDDKTIDFIEHHNKECKRFIYLLKSIILITQRQRKSYSNTIIVMSGKEMYKHIKSSKTFNKIYNSMNSEQKKSYKEYMELFLNMGHSILVGDYNFEMLKKVNVFAIIRNKQIYTDFLNYKKEVENLSMSDKAILNEMPPDESYYIPIQSWIKETKKTGIYGNEALTMKQKFEVLNIKFDPYTESSEVIHSDNPLINPSVNPHTNTKNKNNVDKNTSAKNKDKIDNKVDNKNLKNNAKNTSAPLNETRKASYNKNSGSYLCDPTNFELILPPNHKPSSPVIGKKNMTYYEIHIPPFTEAGSRLRFKQPTPPIKNVDHNAGKNPPNCPRKQRLRSVNHIPTSKEITANRDLDRTTAKHRLSNHIPTLDTSHEGIERYATIANFARGNNSKKNYYLKGNALTPGAGETFTPERLKWRVWNSIVKGQNPLNQKVDFSRMAFV